MEEKITLASLFCSRKEELKQQLEGLLLPKDSNKVQQIITDYLNKLFDSEGEFRQSLTQSEDYMLQAVLSMLNAQQEMSNNLIKQLSAVKPQINTEKTEKADNNLLSVKMSSTQSMVGSAGGALLGKIIMGGWGAVFGAIAGTAVAVYIASKNEQSSESSHKVQPQYDQPLSGIEVDSLTGILSKVCESVDNMMATFRAQINRVVSKYENQEKQSIEKDYRVLLENIQSLVGYSRTHSDDDKFNRKIQERIEDMVDVLDIYDLSFVDYSEIKESWFEKVSSPNTNQPKMVYPAIVKTDEVVIKGKIFVPEN